MKRVYSAGGIVVKRDGDDVKVLVTQHSKHHGWDFPKGHIESGESSAQAALREVQEETGVKAEIIDKVGQTEYFYYEDKQSLRSSSSQDSTAGLKEKVFKTVIYFLMKYVGEGEATTAFEVSEKVWLPIDEVEERLTFKDTKKLWEKAVEKIRERIFDKSKRSRLTTND